jgi:hypothetical protein
MQSTEQPAIAKLSYTINLDGRRIFWAWCPFCARTESHWDNGTTGPRRARFGKGEYVIG